MNRADRKLPKFPERIKPRPAKKDTKKWCRGVVGRKHQIEWVPWRQIHSKNNPYEIQECQVCRKQFKIRRVDGKKGWLV